MTTVVGLLIGVIALAIPAGAAEPRGAMAPYARTSWTEKDGLPSQTISSIAQDRDGYLWVGTARGLVRFDGIRFVVWDRAHLPLTNLGVPALCATSDGSVWRAYWGISRVDRIKGENVESFDAGEGLPEGTVQTLLQDHDGIVWAGGRGGVSRFRDGRWNRVDMPAGVSVWTLYEDRGGNLWATTSAGIFRRSAGSERFRQVERLSQITLGFAEDADGTIWVIDPLHGFKRLAGDSVMGTWGRDDLGDAFRLFSDRAGNIWIGTNGRGLLRRGHESGGTIERYTVETGLAGNVVSSLMEDREGNLWVGTADGLTRFSAGTFAAWPVFDGASGLVRAVAAGKDGGVWIGTRRGLIQFSNGRRRTFGYGDGLPRLMVTALHEDEHGSLWIGTAGGLVRYSHKRLRPVPSAAGLKEISAITTDRKGDVWISDRAKGIFRWHRGRLTAVAAAPDLRGKPAASMYTDRRDRVWIGFWTGTAAVCEDGRFHYYTEKDGLAGGPITAIFEDERNIWIATTNGLSRFDGRGFSTLTARNDLPTDKLSAVVEDRAGFLWVAGNDRVIRLDRADFDRAAAHGGRVRFKLYDTSDGLRGDPLFGQGHPNAARDGTGALWFVTTVGLYVVNPRRVAEHQTPPSVKIEDVIVNDQRFAPAPQLRLPSRVSKLQVNYTALNLRAPGKVRFRSMIEGWDADWIDNGMSRRASYTNLPPGRYRFRVNGSDEDGAWNESGPVFELLIPAAFYQTRWFLLACALALGLAAWGVWQWRIAQVRRRYSFVLTERARLARELHDTLLQSLVGLGLHLDNISDQLTLSSSVDAVKDELRRVRMQVEHYVVEARRSIWDLREPELDRQDLVARLREMTGAVTEGTCIHLNVTVHGSPRHCPATVQQQLLRIAREAVANAVRHGHPERIAIELRYDEDAVALRVVDDGRGFVPDDSVRYQGDHWGLAIMRERAQQIGARLDIASSPGHGTTVEALAPLP